MLVEKMNEFSLHNNNPLMYIPNMNNVYTHSLSQNDQLNRRVYWRGQIPQKIYFLVSSFFYFTYFTVTNNNTHNIICFHLIQAPLLLLLRFRIKRISIRFIPLYSNQIKMWALKIDGQRWDGEYYPLSHLLFQSNNNNNRFR